MRKLVLMFAFLLIPFCSQAQASGDVGCTPDLRAFHEDFTGCDNTALIAPSNDTRANLTLLLLDLRDRVNQPLTGPPSFAYADWPNDDWAWPVDWQNFAALFDAPVPEGQTQTENTGLESEGEGTVCVSDQAGADGFLKAVTAESSIDDAEKQALTDARKAIHCSPDAALVANPPALPTLSLHSSAASEFAAYLTAIDKFYASDRTDPAGFTALKTASNSWIKEAATYMEARVKLLSALNSGLSEYGDVDLSKANKPMASAAADALKEYLTAYPEGAYVNSARGLLRRAYWLAGDSSAQLAAYNVQINEQEDAVPGIDASTLAEEIDAKLPEAAYGDSKADPLLTAIDLLRRMRPVSPDDSDKAQLKASDLDAVKDAFKDKPELFLYLQAAFAYFVQHDNKAVLALVPEQHLTDKLNYLQFSTTMLRAAASGDAKAYADIISSAGSPLQRASAEMAWAMAKEREGQTRPDF